MNVKHIRGAVEWREAFSFLQEYSLHLTLATSARSCIFHSEQKVINKKFKINLKHHYAYTDQNKQRKTTVSRLVLDELPV